MKLQPSEKQLDYLRQIGAWKDDGTTARQPAPRQQKLDKRRLIPRWLRRFTGILGGIAVLAVPLAAFSQPTELSGRDSVFATPNAALTSHLPATPADSDRFESPTQTGVSDSSPTAEQFVLDINGPPSSIENPRWIVSTLITLFVIGLLFALWFHRTLLDTIRSVGLVSVRRAAQDGERNLAAEGGIEVECIHRYPVEPEIPTGEEFFEALTEYARASQVISEIPIISTERWTMGTESDKGPVRRENQDFVFGFRMGQYDVLAMADGMGGLPHGRLASFLAVSEACRSVMHDLGATAVVKTMNASRAIKRAFSHGQHILSLQGDKLGITDINGGLRTTLLMVIAKGNQVRFGYCGDGAIEILRSTGALESFVTPQREGNFTNVLSASLGPVQQGTPVFGQFSRTDGDLVFVMTDGIADRVDSHSFTRNVLRAAIYSRGNLAAVARRVISELTEVKDGLGWVCDDNLTIGLLGTGHSPDLPRGFFKQMDKSTPVEPSVPVGQRPDETSLEELRPCSAPEI